MVQNMQLVRAGVVTAAVSLVTVLLLIAATLAFDPGSPLGIALEAAALIALLIAVTELWADLHGLRWRTITARIVATAEPLARSVGEPGELVAPHPQFQTINVEYVVNGVTHRKQLQDLFEPGTPVTVGRYPIDGELSIFYDPQAPYRSRLRITPNYVGFGCLTWGLLLLGIAVITVV